MLKTLLKEPLLHFIGIALLFFVAYRQMNPIDNNELSISVSEGRLQLLKNQFTERWNREPLPKELQNSALIYAINEMYTREARTLGMDQGDAIIDRRLRQKMDYMLDDIAAAKQPSEPEIQAFYTANAERYKMPEVYSFKQIYLSTDRTEDERARLIAENKARLEQGTVPQGDRTLLPDSVQQQTGVQIQGRFGQQFAMALGELPLGQWQGPVTSSMGLHYVLITEKTDSAVQPMESVRHKILQDMRYENRQLLVTSFEQKLQDKYRIVIEQPEREEPVQ